MRLDLNLSIGVIIGAVLVVVYYKWCESKKMG